MFSRVHILGFCLQSTNVVQSDVLHLSYSKREMLYNASSSCKERNVMWCISLIKRENCDVLHLPYLKREMLHNASPSYKERNVMWCDASPSYKERNVMYCISLIQREKCDVQWNLDSSFSSGVLKNTMVAGKRLMPGLYKMNKNGHICLYVLTKSKNVNQW
jgi:hypothetical protein